MKLKRLPRMYDHLQPGYKPPTVKPPPEPFPESRPFTREDIRPPREHKRKLIIAPPTSPIDPSRWSPEDRAKVEAEEQHKALMEGLGYKRRIHHHPSMRRWRKAYAQRPDVKAKVKAWREKKKAEQKRKEALYLQSQGLKAESFAELRAKVKSGEIVLDRAQGTD